MEPQFDTFPSLENRPAHGAAPEVQTQHSDLARMAKHPSSQAAMPTDAGLSVPAAPMAPASAPSVTSTQQSDEENEEFERKWVAAARNIAGKTKHDPHLESQELNKAAKAYREQLRLRGVNVGEE